LLQATVLDRRHAAAVIIVVLAVDRLGIFEERQESKSGRVALLEFDGSGMIGRMAEIGAVANAAEIREGPVVLRSRKGSLAQSGVRRPEVERKRVHFPLLYESNAGGCLVEHFQH